MNIIFLILIAVLLLLICIRKSKNSIEETKTEEAIYPYSKKHLLTKAEYAFYQVLKPECDKNHLLICPKVRMEDFISVTDKSNYLKYRGYIKSRHIDFIICDAKLQIIGAIELDDNSHLQEKAKKIDEFKDNVCKTISLPLFRVKMSDGAYKEQITSIIKSLVS